MNQLFGLQHRSSSDDEGNEEDDDTLQQIDGIKGIQTPLFNPQNLEDGAKINTIIRKNFTYDCFVIPDELNEIVSITPLVNMIDFTRASFNLALKTNVSTIEDFQSKYPLYKLGSLVNEEPQYGANESAVNGNPDTDYRYVRITDITDDGRLNNDWKTAERVEERYILNEGDILFARSGATAGKVFYYRQEYGKALYAGYLIRFKFNPEKVMPLYVYELLSSITYRNWVINTRGGSAQPNINAQQFASFKIPVPSIESGVQQNLVNECLAINSEYHESFKSIGRIKEDIEHLMSTTQAQAHNLIRLDDSILFDISIGRRVLKSEIVKDGVYDVYSANVFEPFGKTSHSVLSDFSKPSVLWGIDGDWMVNYQEAEKPFNPTDHCGVIRVLDETIVNPRYFVWPLLKAGETERFSRSNRASTERVKALSIMLPDIETQNEVAQQLFDMETEIAYFKSQMRQCIIKKQEILDKYLK